MAATGIAEVYELSPERLYRNIQQMPADLGRAFEWDDAMALAKAFYPASVFELSDGTYVYATKLGYADYPLGKQPEFRDDEQAYIVYAGFGVFYWSWQPDTFVARWTSEWHDLESPPVLDVTDDYPGTTNIDVTPVSDDMRPVMKEFILTARKYIYELPARLTRKVYVRVVDRIPSLVNKTSSIGSVTYLRNEGDFWIAKDTAVLFTHNNPPSLMVTLQEGMEPSYYIKALLEVARYVTTTPDVEFTWGHISALFPVIYTKYNDHIDGIAASSPDQEVVSSYGYHLDENNDLTVDDKSRIRPEHAWWTNASMLPPYRSIARVGPTGVPVESRQYKTVLLTNDTEYELTPSQQKTTTLFFWDDESDPTKVSITDESREVVFGPVPMTPWSLVVLASDFLNTNSQSFETDLIYIEGHHKPWIREMFDVLRVAMTGNSDGRLYDQLGRAVAIARRDTPVPPGHYTTVHGVMTPSKYEGLKQMYDTSCPLRISKGNMWFVRTDGLPESKLLPDTDINDLPLSSIYAAIQYKELPEKNTIAIMMLCATRRGFGQMFYQAFEAFARHKGYRTVMAHYVLDSARDFWVRMGFRVEGERGSDEMSHGYKLL